ncbi:MAG: acylphosphatase [Ruminococcaceae bacterium]|jgi:acylphosphatase|nr:acylphosphatase [Oscillospiraceae bacterium]
MKVRKHIYFSGRVQGVGFRYSATYLARPLELTGWVKNLWDGRVEMEVQGEEDAIWKFLSQLRAQRWIVIDDMDIREMETKEESRFIAIAY